MGDRQTALRHAAPPAAVEFALLLIVLAAFVRTGMVIGIGLDPHHDYFSLAPGLYAGDGLKAHLQFYTHYGVIDAVLRAGLLHLAGGSLLGLRTLAWGVEIISLVLIGYLCRLDRQSRCWLLALIGGWAIWEPSATGLRSTLYWHYLAWSSDLAIPLIAALVICSTWSYRLCLRSAPSLAARWLVVPIAARAILVILITGIKFTIGLSMLTMILLGDLIFWASLHSQQRKSLRSEGTNRKDHRNESGSFPAGVWYFGSLGGGLVGALIVWCLLGRTATFAPILQQVVSGQYAYFSRGSLFLLIDKFVTIAFSQDAFLACLLVICLLASSSKRGRIAQLALVIWLVILRFGDYGERMANGWVSRPVHVTTLSYLIASLIVIASLRQLLQRLARIRHNSSGGVRAGLAALVRHELGAAEAYRWAVLPIGFASLTQFYPINDPMHCWWAVATALPAAALLLQGWFARSWQGQPHLMLWLPICLNAAALGLTAGILTRELGRLPLHELSSPPSRGGLLHGIRSVDPETARTTAALRALALHHPKLILLEAGQPPLFDLYSSPSANRARARCRIEPLIAMPVADYEQLLGCLQVLRREGWDVVFTHNSPVNRNPRLDGPNWQAWWAIVRQGPVPPIVRFGRHKGSAHFSDGAIQGMRYWRLQS
jgi:hypothetical protein